MIAPWAFLITVKVLERSLPVAGSTAHSSLWTSCMCKSYGHTLQRALHWP